MDCDIRLSPKAIRLTDEHSEELSQSESRKSPSGYQGHVRRFGWSGHGAVSRGVGANGEARD